MTCPPCNHNCKDMTSQRFGRLTVVEHLGRTKEKSRNHYWACMCDCGKRVDVKGSNLRRGSTKSCGCFRKEKAKAAGDRTKTHGMCRTSTYNVWSSMIQRCRNQNAKDYPRYGAIGKDVCDRWLSFDNFLEDMGIRPERMSLDRIDNDKGYSKENCRWVSSKAQQRNKTNNRIISHNGKTMTLAEWAEETGINSRTLWSRLKNGWDESDAITTPVKQARSVKC